MLVNFTSGRKKRKTPHVMSMGAASAGTYQAKVVTEKNVGNGGGREVQAASGTGVCLGITILFSECG